jgi:hypothetical protein
MNVDYAVVLVDSTSQAIQIEKILNQRNISCKLIPVPRHLSSDCGVCVRIMKQDVESIKTILMDRQIGYQSIEVIK